MNDLTAKIISYENDEMTEEEEISFFQELLIVLLFGNFKGIINELLKV